MSDPYAPGGQYYQQQQQGQQQGYGQQAGTPTAGTPVDQEAATKVYWEGYHQYVQYYGQDATNTAYGFTPDQVQVPPAPAAAPGAPDASTPTAPAAPAAAAPAPAEAAESAESESAPGGS
jgi:hypothetical protein